MTLDRTTLAVRNLLRAFAAPAYDLGVRDERGMLPGLSGLEVRQVLSRIPLLRFHNSRGADIYIRPSGEHRFTVLDDLDRATAEQLEEEGFGPCALVETSPGNYQAWLKHVAVMPKSLSTFAAQNLALRFAADRNAADWRRFGRLPGFTNRKPKHRQRSGLFPFVLLRSHPGTPFPLAKQFRREVEEQHTQQQLQRASQQTARPQFLSPHRGGRFSHLSLSRFRALTRYEGIPAQADAAFCVAAHALGMPESEMERLLEQEYLSTDPCRARKAAYIRRTITRSRVWATENKQPRTREHRLQMEKEKL